MTVQQPVEPPSEALLDAMHRLIRTGLDAEPGVPKGPALAVKLPSGEAQIRWHGRAGGVLWCVAWPDGTHSEHGSTVAVLTALRRAADPTFSAGRAVIGHRPRAGRDGRSA